jgi:hypothetical protein
VKRPIPDTRDTAEFTWPFQGREIHVEAKGKVIGGDAYQGPRVEDLWIEVTDENEKELTAADFPKGEWDTIEGYAVTQLIEEYEERLSDQRRMCG